MRVIYEWDPSKAADNWRKHRVTLAEAASIFLDPLALTFDDPDHSDEEFREITIGLSKKSASPLRVALHEGRSNKNYQCAEGATKGD